MFNSREINRLKNIIETQKTSENKDFINNAINITAKIKSSVLDASANVYNYTWEAVKPDGTKDIYGGGSSDARCLQEIGQDMTGKSPLANAGDIVSMQCDLNGYRFSVAGGGSEEGVLSPVLDLTDEDNDAVGWEDGKKTVDGEQTGDDTAVKFRFLQRMEYDPEEDKNFEYYRELTIDSKGKLRISGIIQEVGGFETTQHPDE